jgi:hypothetical protein
MSWSYEDAATVALHAVREGVKEATGLSGERGERWRGTTGSKLAPSGRSVKLWIA